MKGWAKLQTLMELMLDVNELVFVELIELHVPSEIYKTLSVY